MMSLPFVSTRLGFGSNSLLVTEIQKKEFELHLKYSTYLSIEISS